MFTVNRYMPIVVFCFVTIFCPDLRDNTRKHAACPEAETQNRAAGISKKKRTPLPKAPKGYRLVWNDEFDNEGEPDPSSWIYEYGFERNRELQWYQPQNAICKDGKLVITGRRERIKNTKYDPASDNWQLNREYAEYTSSAVKTRGKREFLYGRFEICAKIPTSSGSWPAIWTLGNSMPWPSCGEVDIMEYYQVDGAPQILANTAWGSNDKERGEWNTRMVPFSHFLEKDPDWAGKFHVWRMDWDHDYIRLYLDDELLNETALNGTFNGTAGRGLNPFRQPHYLLLNLAIGSNGGTPDDGAFPLVYEVDYVRVYQKK
jgi:beta-glucanase (GH16 family)